MVVQIRTPKITEHVSRCLRGTNVALGAGDGASMPPRSAGIFNLPKLTLTGKQVC